MINFSGTFTSGSAPKDGDIVRPLADGKAPDAPEGFTVVVKENGLMILRKKRYRDLKKVGIGGFQAKTRNPKKGGKDEPSADLDDKPTKKRAAWKPKKNKLLLQYPEYIQVIIINSKIAKTLQLLTSSTIINFIYSHSVSTFFSFCNFE